MTSNVLATGRRTYLHESAALDFAIRACEALGLVFWALAPGTDIWATDYSQNTFRIKVSKSTAQRKQVPTGHKLVEAYPVNSGVMLRWNVVAVGERRTVAQADQWSLFSVEGEAQDVAPVEETAETVAPVVDTAIEAPVVETAPATPVVIEVDSIEGHTATYSGAYADGFTATCTCGWTMAGYALPTNARVAAREHVGDAAQETAPVAPTAHALAVGAGLFRPQCACGWKGETVKSLALATHDAAAHDVCETAAPAEHTVSVEKVRMSSGPGWRAVCTCGHASVAYFAEHAAQSMADTHAKETSPKSRDAIEATATAQGWTIEASIVGDSQSTLTRAGVSLDLEYNVGGNVKRAGVYGQAFGAFGYGDRLAEVTPRDSGKRATVLGWLAAPVGATRAESRDLMRDHVADVVADVVAPSNDVPVVADVAPSNDVPVVADVVAVAATSSNDVADVAAVAPSNDVAVVADETEFAARVRAARAPRVPGIHVARCYRCGERACETLRLPVSSLTNVCSEHADEARAVALRWDAASRYMHEEAPSIASSGRLAVRFTREATNRLDIPLAVIAETLIGADNTFGDIDTTLAQRLDAFTAARGTAPSNPVVGK